MQETEKTDSPTSDASTDTAEVSETSADAPRATDAAQVSQPSIASPTETPAAGEPQPIEGLIEGRIVHYVTDRPLSAGETPDIRPAIIVRIWDRFTGMANLLVFTDGDNDLKFTDSRGSNVVWKTSRVYSEAREPGTWHWPPRA